MAEYLELIDEEEEFVYEWGSSKIYLRRVGGKEQEYINRKHDKRGKTNWTGVVYDTLKRAIKRWENVNLRGKSVEWDPSLVYRIPDDAKLEMLELIGANVPGTSAYEGEADELGNSPTTSGSSTSTEE